MKTYIDREFTQYLLDNVIVPITSPTPEILDPPDLSELVAISVDRDRVRVCLFLGQTPVCLHLPTDIFAGTDNFIEGLNHGFDPDPFWDMM